MIPSNLTHTTSLLHMKFLEQVPRLRALVHVGSHALQGHQVLMQGFDLLVTTLVQLEEWDVGLDT